MLSTCCLHAFIPVGGAKMKQCACVLIIRVFILVCLALLAPQVILHYG